jgi:hypothetical protein
MRVQQVWNAAESGDAELPMARDLVAASLPATTHRVRPAALSSIAQQRMVDTLVRLADLTSPRGFIPVLQSVESPEGPDDPLGIDDVLAKFTGAIERADRATYDTGGRAAMGMAALCAHSRIRYAGVSVAIGAASSHWSRGSPTANLLDINAKLDRDIQHSLKLLIDVAQHARGRNVALKGLRNGLKRAARFIERARTAAANRMASLIGGILLPDPVVEPEFEIPADALSAAWEDGTPQLALEVLETWPDSLERRVALTLTRAVLANDPRVSVAELGELSSEIRGERPMLSAAVDVCLGGCAIWANDIDTALTVAARQRALGRTRRNGMILATGALTEMSVFELRDGPDRARAVRIDAGAELFHMGATAGLSLLARWAPTED